MFRIPKIALVACAALLMMAVTACGGTVCEQACDSFVACQDSGLGLYAEADADDSDLAREKAIDACVASCDSGKGTDGSKISDDKIQCYADANGSCTEINADKSDDGCQGL